jgi:hypothetical protein
MHEATPVVSCKKASIQEQSQLTEAKNMQNKEDYCITLTQIFYLAPVANMKTFLLFLALICTVSEKPAKVYLVPTLHNLHRVNAQYTYDSLIQLIKRLNPDVIAVEIRPEDVDRDSFYLKQNYPYEMWMMKYWFAGKKTEGFDWLGKDVEGKPIPDNYWKEISAIKKWERMLNADSVYSKRADVCDSFTNKRVELLKTLSLKDLLKSKDAEWTKQFYNCMQEQLNRSLHQKILNFYSLRNKKLLQNIQRITRRYKGKTIVILTGDDHYVYLKDKFHNDPLFH